MVTRKQNEQSPCLFPLALLIFIALIYADLPAPLLKNQAMKKHPKSLEIRHTRGAGERNDVADILHTGHKENQTLEAEAKTTVRTGTETAGV